MNNKFSGLTLLSCLGSGAYGLVWRVCEKLEEDNDFAIKVIAVDPQKKEEQEREAKISVTLEHKNLVKVYSAEIKEINSKDLETLIPKAVEVNCKFFSNSLEKDAKLEVFVIKMELCGESVRKWLNQKHDPNLLSVQKMQYAIILDTIEGVKYLHRNKIMHRDIKPENSMFTHANFTLPVKIGDYGQCRYLPLKNQALSSGVGTQWYKAPETWGNNYGLQIDIFSLGCLIWEVGQFIPLNKWHSYIDRLVNDKELELIEESKFIENFSEVVVKLCKRKASERFQNVDEIDLKVKEFPELKPVSPISLLCQMEFQKFLGSGNFGLSWTFTAWHKIMEENVAVKIVPNEEKVNNTRKYATTLGITHPNLIKVYRVDKFNFDDISSVKVEGITLAAFARNDQKLSTFCIQMELCGEDLRFWLKLPHDPKSEEVQNMQFNAVENIKTGLSYLHDNMIIHGNLKPENILFSTQGFEFPLKLGDYNQHRPTFGEPLDQGLYMAPESRVSPFAISFQSDLFSLGLVVWEVMQLLPYASLKENFDRLVNAGDSMLINPHPKIHDLRRWVSNLCHLDIEKRPLSVQGVIFNDDEHGTSPVDEKTSKIPFVEKPFLRFALKTFLGSGSFGIVWKITDSNGVASDFALKVMLRDQEFEEKQMRELDISVSLSHMNLIRCHEAFKTAVGHEDLEKLLPTGVTHHAPDFILAIRSRREVGIFGIKMELCGEDLRSWLKIAHDRNSLAVKKIQLRIVRDVVNGLKYLHQKRIIHRDLKPETILFAENGHQFPMKIGGYGQSRVIKKELTSTLTSSVGTDLYMAPEARTNDYSFKTDLFSLGLIMWEVVQLIPLQNLRPYFDRLVNDREVDLIKETAVIENFQELVEKLCSRKPRNRPQNIDVVEINSSLPGTEDTIKDSAELRRLLEICEDGQKIALLEGTYEGPFVITKSGITLRGMGEKTILTSDENFPILEISGADFYASHFTLNGMSRRNWGIVVNERNSTMEDLSIFNCKTGIHIDPEGTNATMRNINFCENETCVEMHAKDTHASNVSISNCKRGFSINNAKEISITSLKITDPQEFGIEISGSNCSLKLLDVMIKSNTKPAYLPRSLRPFSAIRVGDSPQGNIEIKQVTCSGFDGNEEMGLFLEGRSTTCKIIVTDSCIGKTNLVMSRAFDRKSIYAKIRNIFS